MTVITQQPTLRLRSARDDLKDAPPTYPMYSFDIGMDMYEPEGQPGVHANGIVRKVPYQQGLWVIQPAYAGSYSFMVDLATDNVWTRAHHPATGQWEGTDLIAKLRKFMFPEEARWLHCQRVFTNKKDGTKFATVIFDFVHDTWSHSERRGRLEVAIKQLGVRTAPETGEVYLVPEFPLSIGEDLWAGLHIVNTEWRASQFPAPFYSGIVAKQFDANYFIQLDDHQRRSPKWLYHKFSDPFCEKNES